MPAKNVVRDFSSDSYYHVFNRGVEKRDIFLDDEDYHMFIYYLLIYLSPLEKVIEKYPKLPFRLYNKNLSQEVDIISYCLMPNHFHLLLKQRTRDGVSKLLKQVTNGYTLYFNKKYNRVGGLMQGRFKAVRIPTDELLMHISRYIHLNPVVAGISKDPKDYKWSSYKDYFRGDDTFVKTREILGLFESLTEYENFTNDQIDYAIELNKLKNLSLDD